ncbi:MAG TPA: hypothetical protein VFZ89_11180 [Solirubrobacteraceae bacterium]
MRRALVLAVVLGACALAAPVAGVGAGPAASASAAATCRVLPVTAALKATLLRVRRAAITTPGATTSGPVGRVYYGRCPKAYYALASFRYKTPQLDFGTQDQPERFQRRVGGRWRDLGDTGGFVCEAAPKALLMLWRLQRGCD